MSDESDAKALLIRFKGALQATMDPDGLKAAVEAGLAMLEELSNLQRQLHFKFDPLPQFTSMEAADNSACILWIGYAILYKAEALRSNPAAARNYFNSIRKFADRVRLTDGILHKGLCMVLKKGYSMERYM